MIIKFSNDQITLQFPWKVEYLEIRMCPISANFTVHAELMYNVIFGKNTFYLRVHFTVFFLSIFKNKASLYLSFGLSYEFKYDCVEHVLASYDNE
jgi:hypothetical protein